MNKNIILILAAILCGMSKVLAYDFFAVCSTGQTLYYNITDAVNHEVELTHPNNNKFQYYDPFGSIVLPDKVVFNNEIYFVTSIGNDTFSGCSGLTGSLTIPNSVTSIGSGAFWGCNGFTGSLTIPNSVTSIGVGAFIGCSGFTGNLTIPNSVTSIGESAFYGCSGFTGSLTIPNSVTSIGQYAFEGCSGFTGNLTIPNSVTTIWFCTFRGCSGFTGSLTIPNSVTYIGWSAFEGCSGFTGSLTIPNSVTSIDGHAFKGCSGFTSIVFNASNCHCSHFGDFANLKKITIGKDVLFIPDGAFYNCIQVESIISECYIPPIVGTDAFYGIRTAIPVYVSPCTIQLYKTAEGWNQFVNYQQDSYYHLTVTSNFSQLGTVSIVQQPDCESDAIVLATPIGNNPFSGWMENGVIVSTENPYQFTLTGNRNLVACFGYFDVEDNYLTKVEIYPNPARNTVTISGENLKQVTFSNLTGQRIATYQVENSENQIALSSLPAGLYLLNIIDKNGKCCIRKLAKE